MGFISHHKEEWQLVGNGMREMIVGEFGKSDVLSPGSRIAATKDLKVSLHFLIDMFSFPIGLGVISGGKGKFIAEKFS